MNILEQRFLRGPNLWSDLPCLQTVIGFDQPRAPLWSQVYAGAARLSALPALAGDSPLPDSIAQLALALQATAGIELAFWATRPMPARPEQFRIVFAYRIEQLAREALALALDTVGACMRGEALDVADRLQALKETAQRGAIGTSTAAVIGAARARGIPALRITDEANLFQLGWGSRLKRLQATVTGDTSHVAAGIAANKQLTKALLEQAGMPVPEGGVAADAAEAVALAERLRYPVTVKPLDGNQGKGVTARCIDAGQVCAAFALARGYGRRVIVERFVEGRDYRVLVAGGKVAAASWRRPPSVCGDGAATIAQLVEAQNQDPARGAGHSNILTRIDIDGHAVALLAKQGFEPGSVPAAGVVVQLRANANLSTGGSAEDATDEVHPATRAMCIRAAAAIGLDIAGIDIVCRDISQCLRTQCGAFIEVNAAPGIRMHQHPGAGQARDAGGAIVDALFGKSDGRIPVIAVTGTNGKTTTTLMIGHTARLAGLRTGMTTTEGVYFDGERAIDGDSAGYHSARCVLASNTVDIAVLETARGGILKRGLAFDRCSVGVVLNVSADHLGQDGIETVDQLAEVKAVVANCASGSVVLNADDWHCVQIAANLRCAAETIYFSVNPENPVLLRHLETGGRATYFEDGALVVADGARRHELLQATDVPAALQGHAVYNIANALAAAAALMGAGFTHAQIAAGLSSFTCDAQSNPLRCNVYGAAGVTVIVDYAHNPAAYTALAAMTRSMSAGRRVAVVTAPGDRRDNDLYQLGRTCAAGFDELFIYEADPRGRADGETAGMIAAGARTAGMNEALVHALLPVAEAFKAAIGRCVAGDVLVFACGSADSAKTVIAAHVDPQPARTIEAAP